MSKTEIVKVIHVVAEIHDTPTIENKDGIVESHAIVFKERTSHLFGLFYTYTEYLYDIAGRKVKYEIPRVRSDFMRIKGAWFPTKKEALEYYFECSNRGIVKLTYYYKI